MLHRLSVIFETNLNPIPSLFKKLIKFRLEKKTLNILPKNLMNPLNPMNPENPMNLSFLFAEQTDDFLDTTSFDSNNSFNVAFSNESNYDCRNSYDFKLTIFICNGPSRPSTRRAALLKPPEE